MNLAHQSLVHEVPNLLALGALGAAIVVTFLTAATLKVSLAR